MHRSISESLYPTVPFASAGPPERSRASVVTRMVFDGTPAQAWKTLMFYEQLDRRPPLYLRLLLPVPLGTTGSKSKVGDEAHCSYRGGHLIKRVTRVEDLRAYGFQVVKQELSFGGGMRLSGGEYSLRELAPGRTEVAAVTNYESPRRPRWLWRPIETAVCHLFHQHILRAMRRSI